MANYQVIEHENETPQFPNYWFDQHNLQEIHDNNFNDSNNFNGKFLNIILLFAFFL